MSSLSENVQSNQVVASPHGKKSSDPEMSGFALRFNEDSDKYRITTDYNYILTQDSENPAFILNNVNIRFKRKAVYVITLKSTWFMIFMLLLYIISLNILIIVLRPTQYIFISRDIWDPNPTNPDMARFQLPIKNIIVTHTNDELGSCYSTSECITRIRKLHRKHLDLGLDDIAWNFLIGDDGNFYVARGFSTQGEIFSERPSTSAFNELGMFVAFIGNFTEQQPSNEMLESFDSFIDNLVSRELAVKDFTLLLQDQLALTKPDAVGLLNVLRSRQRFRSFEEISSRSQWTAKPQEDPLRLEKFSRLPKNLSLRMIEPVNRSAICVSFDECSQDVKNQQEKDFAAGFNDLNFNFVISGHGIFEGRGWDVKHEAQLEAYADYFVVGLLTDDLYKGPAFLNATLDKLVSDGKFLRKLDQQINIICEKKFCT